jgi:5-methylthioadenosine/S-adenosylhomocysteine deaminase
MNILLKNAIAITTCDTLNNCNIEIIDNKIHINHIENKHYDKIIDCTNKVVLPGFINSHTHSIMIAIKNLIPDLKLDQWLIETQKYQSKFTNDLAYWAIRLAIVEMIKSGITTFADSFGFNQIVEEAIIESQVRGFIFKNTVCNDYVKPFLGVAINKLPINQIKAESDKSLQFNIPLHLHLAETQEELNYFLQHYNMTPVKYLDSINFFHRNVIASHCIYVNDEDIEILKKNNVNVVHNPKSNLKLASGIAPVYKMLKKGINVCLGTDSAASNNNLDMIEEMKMTYYIQKIISNDVSAVTIDNVLNMATINGAKAFKLNAGKIEDGNLADLIILDIKKPRYYPLHNIKSSIINSGNSSDIETVIINGKIIMENNKILSLDEEEVLYNVNRFLNFYNC